MKLVEGLNGKCLDVLFQILAREHQGPKDVDCTTC